MLPFGAVRRYFSGFKKPRSPAAFYGKSTSTTLPPSNLARNFGHTAQPVSLSLRSAVPCVPSTSTNVLPSSAALDASSICANRASSAIARSTRSSSSRFFSAVARALSCANSISRFAFRIGTPITMPGTSANAQNSTISPRSKAPCTSNTMDSTNSTTQKGITKYHDKPADSSFQGSCISSKGSATKASNTVVSTTAAVKLAPVVSRRISLMR